MMALAIIAVCLTGVYAVVLAIEWWMRWSAECEADERQLDATLAVYRQIASLRRANYIGPTYAAGDPLPKPKRAPLTARIAKCESCGSREWTPHAGKEVCAYCRSERV